LADSRDDCGKWVNPVVAGVPPAKFKNAAGTAASTNLFWRKRGDNFFEAWIAAERVPEGEQL
jgi:hypothetical protein